MSSFSMLILGISIVNTANLDSNRLVGASRAGRRLEIVSKE
jgi:hypothetical protein